MLGRRRSVPRNGSTNHSTNDSSTELCQQNGSASYPRSPSSSFTATNGVSGAVNHVRSANTNGNGNGYGYHVHSEESADAGVEVGIELTREVMGASKSKESGVGRGSKVSNGYEAVEREEPLLHADDEEDPDKPDADESTSWGMLVRSTFIEGHDAGRHRGLGLGGRPLGDSCRDQELGAIVSAALLLSPKDRLLLRSGGDPSLGPAFRRHVGSINSAQRARLLEIRGGASGDGGDGGHIPLESWAPTNGAQGSGANSGASGRSGGGSYKISGRPLVYLCAICSSLCSILLGYDVGVMSGAKEFIKPDLQLSSFRLELMVGSLNLVAAFGGLVAGKTADRLGRKPTIALACVVFIVGAAMMSASHDYSVLLIGRIITGVGVGCAMVIAPVYITELAPPDVRGMLVSLTDICINFGIVLGFASTLMCMSAFESDSARWRSMIGIGTLPPALILLCLTVMPESPRWLIARGQDSLGLDVLNRVLGDEAEAIESLRTISQATSGQREASWMDVLVPKDRVVRAAVLLGVGLGFFQQASGSEAAVYYTPDVLKNNGWTEKEVLVGNMGVGGFKLAGEVVAFVLLDRIGRRPLFLASSILVTICLVLIGISFHEVWDTATVLFWLCMFMFTFSLGLGPVTFVVASEILPVSVRGKAMSLVIFVNRLMSGLIASSFVSLEESISRPMAFYVFAFFSAVSIAFYFLKVPETRGRTLEQITADLDDFSPPSVGGQGGGTDSNDRGGGRHVPLPNTDEDMEE